MPNEEDIIRFTLNVASENRARLETLTTDIRHNDDPVVNYLKADDPMQYVVRGLLLCETKMKELIAKHVPGAYIETSKFVALLKILRVYGFLDGSEIPPYKKLNDLRNRVAHQLNYKVTKKDAADIWNTLNGDQRTQIEYIYGFNYSGIKDNPTRLVKAIVLRLYTHLVGIVEREDLRLQVQALFLKKT